MVLPVARHSKGVNCAQASASADRYQLIVTDDDSVTVTVSDDQPRVTQAFPQRRNAVLDLFGGGPGRFVIPRCLNESETKS